MNISPIEPGTLDTIPALRILEMSPTERHGRSICARASSSGGYGEMTSEDAAYPIARFIREDLRAGPVSPMRRAIASVETPDEYTVVVNLNFPDFEFAQGYGRKRVSSEKALRCARGRGSGSHPDRDRRL